MGTRGLLGFIIRGRRKGTYNHWDSYPEGLGAEIAEFIASLTEEQCRLMAERLEQVKLTTSSTTQSCSRFNPIRHEPQIKWIRESNEGAKAPADIAQQYRNELFDCPPTSEKEDWPREREEKKIEPATKWYELLAGTQGARMLQPILDGRLRHLIDCTEFVEDQTFCEWGYWIDFDRQELTMEYNLGEWTFEEVKKEGGFWMMQVQNIQRSERERQEYLERKKVDPDAQWVDRSDEHPDPWKCPDAPCHKPEMMYTFYDAIMAI